MSKLPVGWVETSLSSVASLNMGQSPLGEFTNKEGRGLPLIGGAADYEGDALSPSRHTSTPTKVCKAGDIVLCIRATIGKAVFADREYCLGRGVAGVRPHVEPTWLRWKLVESADALDAAGVGTTFRQIDKQTLEKWPVRLPPLPEQRRIVAKIDSLTGKSRRARDHLDHIPRLVEKYKQAVLAAAFRGDLTQEWRAERSVSAIYRTASLADVLTDIRYGTAKKCDYGGGAIPVVRIPNVQQGEIALDDLKYADFDEAERRKLQLQPGDLLVIRSNGSLGLVGRCAVVNNAAAGMLFAGYLIRLRFDAETILPRYVHLWLQSGSMRSVIEGLAKSTSGVNNINSTQIEQLPIKVARLDEQGEIVRRIDVAFKWIERLASEATSARRLIDHLDQSVLAQAFRGELVPQDPTDEPASVLLERIRAARGTAPNVKRGRRG